jgi:hypothetical protein
MDLIHAQGWIGHGGLHRPVVPSSIFAAPLNLQLAPVRSCGGRCPVERQEEITPVTHDFKVGDHVEWNSEAGRVRGTIKKKHTSEITFKGYTVHASKEEPQYLIKSDKTDHLAMHKGSALRKIDKSKI